MPQDLVSVIVPVYNVELYLNECIDSILNQTHKDLEVILINDGSTDESGEVCDDYKRKEPRVKVIHKSNGGQSQARNRGLDIAKGDFISFIDSDDYVHKRFIEVLLYGLKKHDVDISYCDFSNKKLALNKDIKWEVQDFDDIYIPFVNRMRKVGICNKLYKKYIWDNLRFLEGKTYEDQFIFHELNYNRTFSYTHNPMYYYRSRPDSTIHSQTAFTTLYKVQAQRKRLEFFQEIGNKKYIKEAEERYLFKMTYLLKDTDRETPRKILCRNYIKVLRLKSMSAKQKAFLTYRLITGKRL